MLLRTFFENTVESVSLYEPVMIFSFGLRPRIHSTNSPAVRLLP